MTALIILTLTSVCVGVFIVRAIAPEHTPAMTLSCGILIGTTVPALVLFLLSLLQIRWSLAAMTLGTLAIAVLAFIKKRKELPARQSPARREWLPSLVDLVTLTLLIGYALFATVAPPAEGDFVTLWGLKARVFLHAGAIDFAFLTSPWNDFSLPDYPILLPLIFDSVTLLDGEWNPEGFGLLYAIWGGAVLLLIRSLLQDESGSALFSAVATLTLASSALSPFLGLAEGPLIAYGTAGILMIRRGLQRGMRDSLLLGAVLLGLSTQFKNEGLTLVAAVIVAVILTRPDRLKILRSLWPAVVIPVPWLILRTVHGLPTYLAERGVFARIWTHLQEGRQILEAIRANPLGNPFFWAGIFLAAVLVFRRALSVERFTLAVIVFQYLFFIAAYLATPYSIDWHFKWSWERVIGQQTLLLAFVLVASLAPLLITDHGSRISDVSRGRFSRDPRSEI